MNLPAPKRSARRWRKAGTMLSLLTKLTISRRLIVAALVLYSAVARTELSSRWHHGLKISLLSQGRPSLIDRVKLILWLEVCASIVSIGPVRNISTVVSIHPFAESVSILSADGRLYLTTKEQDAILSYKTDYAAILWCVTSSERLCRSLRCRCTTLFNWKKRGR